MISGADHEKTSRRMATSSDTKKNVKRMLTIVGSRSDGQIVLVLRDSN